MLKIQISILYLIEEIKTAYYNYLKALKINQLTDYVCRYSAGIYWFYMGLVYYRKYLLIYSLYRID